MTPSVFPKNSPLALSSLVGASLGGLTGLALGGPTGAIYGAKTGLSLGAQTGLLFKADKALDTTGNKIIQGIDNAGRKVEVIADKTGAAIEQAGNAVVDAIVRVVDVGSKVFLAGAVIQLGMTTFSDSIKMKREFCVYAWESLECAAISMTTLSSAFGVIMVGYMVTVKAYEIIKNMKS